jgi:hypothetical protein
MAAMGAIAAGEASPTKSTTGFNLCTPQGAKPLSFPKIISAHTDDAGRTEWA